MPRWPLIHLDEPHRFRPGWREYLASFDVDFRDDGGGLRLNDYALVLQAAMAGEGLALGWLHVCERPLAQGWLQSLGPWEWQTGDGFYLVWSATRPISPHAALTRDWILAEAASTAVMRRDWQASAAPGSTRTRSRRR